MKTLAWIIAPVVGATGPTVHVDFHERLAAPEVVLAAIAQVESATPTHPLGDDAAIGKKGERSRYQLMEMVWYSHTGRHFTEATFNPELARQVATAHLARLTAMLTRRKEPATPRRLAQLWNPRASRDYAQRVVNLCEEQLAKTSGPSKS